MSSRIQPDAPHPDSYRPDLPLRSELLTGEREEQSTTDDDGYDEGFEDGEASGRRLSADRITALEAENARLRQSLEKTA
jgi:hypothetical protein